MKRIFYSSMGSFYKVCKSVDESLRKDMNVESAFYVCDKDYITKNISDNKNSKYIYEWELYDIKPNDSYSLKILNRIEKEYFLDKSVWRAIVNDRRLYNGVYCKYKQDYNSTFSFDELLTIFQKTFLKIESFFNTFSPNIIIGSTPSTLGEYIIITIAKKRNIKIIIPRHTKIKNRFTVVDNLNESFPKIKLSFDKKDFDTTSKEEAFDYIQEFNRKRGVIYEGSIKRGNYLLKNLVKFILAFPKLLVKEYIVKKIKGVDLHGRGNDIYKLFLIGIAKDFRAIFYPFFYKKTFKNLKEIKSDKYLFFPLHSEPEVAITLFSKGFYNQIELIREISFNLPVGYKLMVNEHPRNIGKRKIGFYKKISSIPNVSMANFNVNTYDLIENSSLVIVLSGFVGFESALLKKPVIALGNANYKILPKKIINKAENIKDLYREIQFSLGNYSYDEESILDYLSSVIFHSRKVNFYNVLLAKDRMGKSSDLDDYDQNINALTNLIKYHINV